METCQSRLDASSNEGTTGPAPEQALARHADELRLQEVDGEAVQAFERVTVLLGSLLM